MSEPPVVLAGGAAGAGSALDQSSTAAGTGVAVIQPPLISHLVCVTFAVFACLVAGVVTALNLTKHTAGTGVTTLPPGIARLVRVSVAIFARLVAGVSSAGHLPISLAGAGVAVLRPGFAKSVLVAMFGTGVATPPGGGALDPSSRGAGAGVTIFSPPGLAHLVTIIRAYLNKFIY